MIAANEFVVDRCNDSGAAEELRTREAQKAKE
jgi:hypothetical protein